MKVLFVCTGNICRSPMGEFLFPLFFRANSVETDSAGIQGLEAHPIDPSSAALLARDGVDSSHFRSKRLTPQMENAADLILCFSNHQRREIITMNPRVRRRTFKLTDLAQLCHYLNQRGLIEGNTPAERLHSTLANATLVRPNIVPSPDIEDPYQKDFKEFESVHNRMIKAFAEIADALDTFRGLHAR